MALFHILPADAKYRAITPPNTQMRDPDDPVRQTINAACGATLVRYRDEYCNVMIANPEWNREWCHDCVRAFRWPQPTRAAWEEQLDISDLPPPPDATP